MTRGGGTAPNGVIAGVTGASGGFLSGILGGGGGAVMVPLMTGPMRMRQHVAHGTSLAIIVVTAAVAAASYTATETISWHLVVALGCGAVAGAQVGARAAARIPAMRLRQLFGVFLVAISARLVLEQAIEPVFAVSGAREAIAGGAIGLVGGVASGALGVGGGAIFVPALVLLLGVEQHEAQGVSLFVVVVASLGGAWAHYRQGTVDMRAARWIAPAALPGAVAGAVVAGWLSGRSLQVVFAVILTAIGIQMFATATMRMRRAGAAPVAAEAQAG